MLLLRLWYLLAILPMVHSHPQKSRSRGSSSYVAASVSLYTKATISEYESLLVNAVQLDPLFSVIVFPELGLNLTEDTAETIGSVGDLPCNDTTYVHSPSMTRMSCGAGLHQKYVVFDLREHGEECSNRTSQFCYNDKFFLYNTAVAFDREGRIVAKYRKHHITDPPFKPGPSKLVSFDTDFGVTFGLFICYDIMFHVPAQSLVEEKKIVNFVYPLEWADHQPLTSMMVQQGWSEYFGTNLIAANCEKDGSSVGTGLFSRGQVVAMTSDTRENQVLFGRMPAVEWVPPPVIPKLPTVPFENEMKRDGTPAIPGLQKTVVLNLTTFSCQVSLEVSKHSTDNPNPPDYLLIYAIKNAAKQMSAQYMKMIYCGVANCGPNPSTGCLKNTESSTTLASFKVEVQLTGDHVRVMESMVSTNQLMPLKEGQVEVRHEGAKQWIASTESLAEPLVSFGMLGVLDEDT